MKVERPKRGDDILIPDWGMFKVVDVFVVYGTEQVGVDNGRHQFVFPLWMIERLLEEYAIADNCNDVVGCD